MEPEFLLVKMIIQGVPTPPKKILKPKTIALMIKQCTQLFKPEKPIQSILKEDGTAIDAEGLKHLEIGATVTASTRKKRVEGENDDAMQMFREIEDMDFIGRPKGAGGAGTSQFNRNAGNRAPSDKVSFVRQGLGGPVRSNMRDSEMGSSRRSSAQGSPNEGEDSRSLSRVSRKRYGSTAATVIGNAFRTLLPNDTNLTTLDYFVMHSDKKDFLLKLLPIEELQAKAWGKAVLSLPVLSHILQGVQVYDAIQRYATGVIEQHRFLSGKWADHRMRLAVVGPVRSGKSVLLAEITRQLVTEMVYTGEWKTTFVFALDALQIVPLCHNYADLFEFFLDQSIDAISAEKPALTSALRNAKKKLSVITEVGAAEPVITSRTPFDNIALQLSEAWQDPDGIDRFFWLVFHLPIVLARAVGFESVVMVVDNLDAADVQVQSAAPFTVTHEFVFIGEVLKFALDNTDFIVAAQDTNKCMQLLGLAQQDGTDLLGGLDLATTFDISEPVAEEGKDRFAVRIDGDIQALELNELMCGGVVHYLTIWQSLCSLMGSVEGQHKGPDHDRLKIQAIMAAQELMSLVYAPETKEFRVTSITRIKEPGNF
jgi:hypothetical protein